MLNNKELLDSAIAIYAKLHRLDLDNVHHKIFARDRVRQVKTNTFRAHVIAKKAAF